MRLTFSIFLFLGALFFSACSTPKAKNDSSVYMVELRNLDTLEVIAPSGSPLGWVSNVKASSYRGTPQRTIDILHLELHLSFAWESEQVSGRAILHTTPYFEPLDTVRLDAKQIQVDSVWINGIPCWSFYTTTDHLVIPLNQMAVSNDTLIFEITYQAQPAKNGGSNAIRSNQGMFFINPTGSEIGKPQQIWTQGETNWNSKWIPMIDEPNERFTQDIFLRVEPHFTTLSNGELVSQIKDDGMRVDHWQLRQPHAPYLIMIAVGEWAVVEDQWEDLPMAYYVDEAYREDAKSIFAHSKEMLSFFSNRLGVPFPWPSYRQLVARDFVSGAMENTTAVVYGDFVQQHKQELIDQHNDAIVAHELMHHWFGNLVTCENWANLVLNEGFATYAEYLWFEHFYGIDEASYHLYGEQQGYLGGFTYHPLVHYQYAEAEDMFDTHSYNKGALVLHMMRKELGDKAFFASLQHYLKKHAFGAVEIEHLRQSFEDITGKDLKPFFDQWFLSSGHPQLNITHTYQQDSGWVEVLVEQIQNVGTIPKIFTFPMEIAIFFGSKEKRFTFDIFKRKQSIKILVAEEPDLILPDPDRKTVAEINYVEPTDFQVARFFLSKNVIHRLEALHFLIDNHDTKTDEVLQKAIEDPFWAIRARAAEEINVIDHVEILKKLAKSDPHSSVRTEAMLRLSEAKIPNLEELSISILHHDSVFMVMGAALEILANCNPSLALDFASKLEDSPGDDLILSIAHIYMRSKNPEYLSFFEQKENQMEREVAFFFFDYYQKLAQYAGKQLAERSLERIFSIATNQSQPLYRRYAATHAINEWKNNVQADANLAQDEMERQEKQLFADYLRQKLVVILEVETEARLRANYKRLTDILPQRD